MAPVIEDGEQAEGIRPAPLPAAAPAQTSPSIAEEKPEESGQREPDIRVSDAAKQKLPPNVYRFTPKTPAAIPQLSELFRYELDIRELKRKPGYKVLIRRRLKWSAARYIRTVVLTHCPDLTAAHRRSIRQDKLTPATLAAFGNGGIKNEITKVLCERPGRGRGKRAAQLTDDERALVRRLERTLAGDGASRNRAARS
jgi:hypothetical protein